MPHLRFLDGAFSATGVLLPNAAPVRIFLAQDRRRAFGTCVLLKSLA